HIKQKKHLDSLAIKKRSRVPGVMITQFVEQLPAGKSTPDFARKPMTTTVQEGKKAFFKAMVSGEPPPTVTWGRNKGEMDDTENYSTRYDERAREHVLEIVNVKLDQADSYKCFATNEYGQAVCVVTLNVIEGRISYFHLLKQNILPQQKIFKRKKQLPPQKEGEIDPKLLELLISAPKKDYERICWEFGITDFRWLLKKLKQMKKEREDEQSKVVENLDNVKQIEVKPSGNAEFSFDMKLRDPNSSVNLYKDGMMIPYDDDKNSKHSLQKTGTNYVFSIKDPQKEDAGFYQVDVEETNVLTTDFQVPDVDFVAKIKSTKVTQNEDAIFQCVLSTPINKITWSKEDASLEDGGKYEITVSEDKLTHTLRIKDCQMADKGEYYAIAGITSSSASLSVQDDASDKKKKRKFKVDMPQMKALDFESPPSFIIPLKRRTAPEGYECYMTCAVRGDPTPHVTWYHNNISLNTNTNYHITNVCGVCSLLILRVGPKDNGEYKVVIENKLGNAESSMALNVRGKIHILKNVFYFVIKDFIR
uniref:Immunoglobulin-like and fibronectin type III domain-containing protein 1 n=1 Tax=Cyprinodon variegatus TaxID=28743 RepID=A0A3Q2E957_CYPVA